MFKHKELILNVILLSSYPLPSVLTFLGCPANETTTDELALTPQKIAKAEGYKDAMKELKKLTTFQDKADRGVKPKGFSEPWAVKVSRCRLLLALNLYFGRPLPFPAIWRARSIPICMQNIMTTFTTQYLTRVVVSFSVLDSFMTGFK